jgi:hypothetical protein
MFIHRWEPKNGGKTHELVIEIPKNIKEILTNPEI